MSREVGRIIKAVSHEMSVDEEIVLQALEAALAAVTAKRYTDDDIVVRVAIDRQTADYEAFRCWTIVADDAPLEFPGQQMHISAAKALAPELEVGDVIEEPIVPAEFGRIAAQQAKQIIMQKVREAERMKIADQYSERIGELFVGVVKKVMRDGVYVDLNSSIEAFMPREEMLPRDAFRMGDRIRASLHAVQREKRGAQLILSRTCPQMLIALFRLEVPEISEEVIEIKAAARDPGVRAKIAVKTNDGRIDPIGACIGMRGARVQAVSSELGGERVDIILWDDNPAQLVINAMAPAEVASIVVYEERKAMDIAVREDQLSLAIGRNGQNVRLASELTGWTLNVMSETQAAKKSEAESEQLNRIFMEHLGVGEDISNLLLQAGFSNVEEVAYVPGEELLTIEGFDEELVVELQKRARDAVLTKELLGEDKLGLVEPDKDLLDLTGMSPQLAYALAGHGIVTREDLAEQAVDDLCELNIGLGEEEAADFIMKARAHWFTD